MMRPTDQPVGPYEFDFGLPQGFDPDLSAQDSTGKKEGQDQDLAGTDSQDHNDPDFRAQGSTGKKERQDQNLAGTDSQDISVQDNDDMGTNPPPQHTKGSLDMNSLSTYLSDLQTQIAGFGAWAGRVHASSKQSYYSDDEDDNEDDDKLTIPQIAEEHSTLLQLKIQRFAYNFGLKLEPLDLSDEARKQGSLPRRPVRDLTRSWMEDHKNSHFEDLLIENKYYQILEADEANMPTPPFWRTDLAADEPAATITPIPPISSTPSLPPLTARQQKAWNRGEKHAPKAKWVIASSDGGQSLKKMPKALYNTWQLPPRVPKCKDSDAKAAKMCKSLHLTGYYAGAEIVFASNFRCCPACDSSASTLIPLTVKLSDGEILVMINPDFGVDTDGNIRLHKATAIKKGTTVIEPGQVVRTGLQNFAEESFLGLTFHDVKLSGGTYKGLAGTQPSTSKLTKWGKEFKTNALLKSTAELPKPPKKRGRAKLDDDQSVPAGKKRRGPPPADAALDAHADWIRRRAFGEPEIKLEDGQQPADDQHSDNKTLSPSGFEDHALPAIPSESENPFDDSVGEGHSDMDLNMD